MACRANLMNIPGIQGGALRICLGHPQFTSVIGTKSEAGSCHVSTLKSQEVNRAHLRHCTQDGNPHLVDVMKSGSRSSFAKVFNTAAANLPVTFRKCASKLHPLECEAPFLYLLIYQVSGMGKILEKMYWNTNTKYLDRNVFNYECNCTFQKVFKYKYDGRYLTVFKCLQILLVYIVWYLGLHFKPELLCAFNSPSAKSNLNPTKKRKEFCAGIKSCVIYYVQPEAQT